MILGVIPARFASSRFPGKPLKEILGKSMIRRVYEQCNKASQLSGLIVATDDRRILEHVQAFGGKAEMTAATHASGSERLSEIAGRYPQFTHFVNIQGDEPFIEPEQINQLSETLLAGDEVRIATLVKRIHDPAELTNPNVVKVVLSNSGDALYFSRSPIPFCRKAEPSDNWLRKYVYYRHIGIYGFHREVLLAIPNMKPALAEEAESLEQLRWLANGYRIRTAETPFDSLSIDSPEDLERAIRKLE
jgi:3-deoxy-manno-octulosonate cytidylyltransferase (CMP-KDO synthetase)